MRSNLFLRAIPILFSYLFHEKCLLSMRFFRKTSRGVLSLFRLILLTLKRTNQMDEEREGEREGEMTATHSFVCEFAGAVRLWLGANDIVNDK